MRVGSKGRGKKLTPQDPWVLSRRLLFSKAPLKGFYRFGDVFQLTPAPDSWPRPPVIMGDYPLILELRHDPKIALDRESDHWRRDLFERDREKKLGTKGWTDGQIDARRRETKMWRETAIRKELTVILSTLTNHRIFDYGSSVQHSWTIIRLNPWFPLLRWRRKVETRWAQIGYQTDDLGWPPGEFFSDPILKEAPRVPIGDHFKNLPDSYMAGAGNKNDVQFHDALDELINIYLSLDANKKRKFYSACHLWTQAFDLKEINAPSMSLLASVSSIETLQNFGADAGTSKTKRFKEFFKENAGPGAESLAAKLYKIRGDISHDGDLLREELFDGGFTIGGGDEQMLFPLAVTQATHIALVNWLISQS